MRLYDIKQSTPFTAVALSIFLGILPDIASSAEEKASKAPEELNLPDAVVETVQPQTSLAPPQEQQAQFDLLELRVKGNTLLERKELERVIYPFLGPKKTADAVEKASKALEELYHAKGYQSVEVYPPEQSVENGVVHLQVVEGKISRLRVKDAKYFSLDKIKEAVPEIAEGKTPNFPIMQKQLEELSNKSSDRQITPILRAGDAPGTLEVDLKVKDKLPLHGRLEMNGRNTSTTSDTRLVASLHYDNLWQKLHSASLMYQVSPEISDQVDVWAATYAMPLFDSDTKLAFYGVHSATNAPSSLTAGSPTVIGKGNIYGIKLVKPLPSLENYTHSITAGIDYKDFEQTSTVNTPITYLPFSLQYNAFVRGKKSLTSFNSGLNFSVRGLGNEQKQFDDGQGNGKRTGSRSDYAYVTAGLNFNYSLPLGMEFASRIAGQLANSPLIQNEQLSLGGMQTIRGYFETQVLADDGFNGSLELRSPRLVPDSLSYVNKLQALAFVDGGRGWIQEAPLGVSENENLASTGVGMRFQMWRYLMGVVDVGFPLIDQTVVKAGDPKVHFNIATEF
jgi:hemolysin activation/secretion protein